MRKTFASIPQRASHFLLVKVVVLFIVESLLTSPVAALNRTGPLTSELVTPVKMESSAPIDSANAGRNTELLTVFSNPASISVPDQTFSSVQSNITVTGMSGTISNVNLTLNNLTSCDANALDLLLVGPGGQKYIFMADVGGFLVPASNVTLTVSDSAATQLPDNGALATGTFRPANYSDIGDSFPSPAPAGPYSSAGPEGVPPLTLTNVFGGLSTINGTWSLFVADNIALCAAGSTIAGGWSLDITSAAAAATTTVVNGSPNPSFRNQAVTITSTTTSGATVNSGSVTFVDTTTSTTLCSNVAVNGSGQATCTVPANTLSERRHTIQANYGGNATFAPSNGSYVQTVNCPVTQVGNTFTNGCGITIPDAGPTTSIPYPSNIVVSGLSGSISKVTLTLTNVSLSQTADHNFLLVGPAGQTYVFMSDAGGSVASSGVNWTFDDAAANPLPNSGSIPTGTYRPTDYNVDSETWPAPAPAGPYNTAPPNGSSTFASVYGGAAPNGTWSLYPSDDTGSGGAGGTIGSWSLTFTTSGDAPTTTTASGSPNPSTTAQSFVVTATVTSTTTVNAGTVTFRRGATILCATVPVASGTATCNVAALPEGDYVITADYNGSPGQFNISSGSYTQMVNSPTVVTCLNFANNGGITVPNSSSGNPYPSRILVSGLGGTITKVTVTINGLTTPTPDDLDLLLVGPGGQKFLFMGDAGGSSALSNVNITLDDAAASQLPDATVITSGTWRPTSYTGFDSFPAPAPAGPYNPAAPEGTGTFANVFNGIAPNGTWSLYAVEDSGDAVNATISNWSLTFTLAAVATTTAVTSSVNPSIFGQPVTFTATVSTAGLGTPTGNVQFFDGATPIGGPIALNASGQAQVTTSSLTVTNHTITANYAGSGAACTGTFNASSGSLGGGQNVLGTATWDGSNSGDWHDPANWSTNFVPTSPTLNVDIPAAGVTNNPIINSADVTVANLTIGGTRTITINAGRTLNATGVVSLGTGQVIGLGTLSLGTAATITHGVGGQVNATFRKNFAGPTGTFEFPVGTTGAFSPLNVTVTSGSGQLTARANTGVPAVLLPNSARTLQRYWTLSGAGIMSNIQFNYLNADVPPPPNDENIWNIIRVTGTTAVRYPPTLPYVLMEPASNRFTISGLTTYSDWTAGEPLAPTAANVGISGRVVDSNGQGVYGARVAVQSQEGNVLYAITNPFGYYSITGVPAGQTYLVSVQHKRYQFTARTISVNEDLTDFDFIAQSEAVPDLLDSPGKAKRRTP